MDALEKELRRELAAAKAGIERLNDQWAAKEAVATLREDLAKTEKMEAQLEEELLAERAVNEAALVTINEQLAEMKRLRRERDAAVQAKECQTAEIAGYKHVIAHCYDLARDFVTARKEADPSITTDIDFLVGRLLRELTTAVQAATPAIQPKKEG